MNFDALPKHSEPLPPPDSDFTTAGIAKHASALTFEQRKLLDGIWRSQWSLDKPFPKRGLPRIIGRRPFEEVAGTVLHGLAVETYDGVNKCYVLTVHGALFSSEGANLHSMLLRLTDVVKALYEDDQELNQIAHEVLNARLQLSPHDSLQLATLLQCRDLFRMPFYFSGRSHDRSEWSIAITDEITDLFQAVSSEQFLAHRLYASRTHSPVAPIVTKGLLPHSWPADGSWWTDYTSKTPTATEALFVTHGRLKALKAIRHPEYDCTRLVSLCEELNDCAAHGNAHAVIMLTRAVLDHVAPPFGCTAFKQVASNYGCRSFKLAMERLEQHTRKVADRLLHTTIRKRELAPTMKEVDFSPEVETLLAEFCRLLKE